MLAREILPLVDRSGQNTQPSFAGKIGKITENPPLPLISPCYYYFIIARSTIVTVYGYLKK
jgi:hypothetical protein